MPSTAEPPYRIAIVCLGNICRSPMAQVVLERRIEEAGLSGEVEVESAGTGDWHVGGPMDERAARTLDARGYDPTRHRARQFQGAWYADRDLVLALDASNREDLAALAPGTEELAKLRMFRSFDPQATDEDDAVPDPWRGGEQGFVDLLATIERTADAIVQQLPGLIGQRGSAR
ncbi:MAG: low molecular weight protein-tyrosine-phosphatase [Nocardioidaceae bacterium]